MERARIEGRTTAVLVSILLLAGLLMLDPGAAGAQTSKPPTPTSVTLGAGDAPTTLRVSWAMPTGTPAESFTVQVFDDSGFVGQALCLSSSCRSQRLPGLTPGRRYRADVYARNLGGWSTAGSSGWRTVTSGCPTSVGLSATVDANATRGAAELRAQGFLHALRTPLAAAEIAALRPQQWRVRAADWHANDYDNARATGAEVTVILSDIWRADTVVEGGGSAVPVWEDWDRYRDWVEDFARDLIASGRRPDYWDVQNEPGVDNYYNDEDTAAWTEERMFEQFRIAYEAIKSVDPNARIIGPSLAYFTDVPNPQRPLLPDLQAFLAYADAHDLRPAALSWHELWEDAFFANRYFSVSPNEIVTRVNALRTLIQQYDVGNPQIFINEYNSPVTRTNPGWNAGYITAMEAANVDQANRACWDNPAGYSECDYGLNGLFNKNRTAPNGVYWVHRFYAEMTGNRVTATTSSVRLSTFATKSGDGTIRALLGRHEQCTPTVPAACSNTRIANPAVMDVPVTFTVPLTSTRWQVVVNRIPADGGPLAAPVQVLNDPNALSVLGRLTVTVPQFADGEAYTVTLTPVAPVPTGAAARQ